MLGPDGLESPHAVGRLDVADDADDHDRRGLDDGHGLDHFLLVRLGSGPIHQTANMRHTGLWRRRRGNEVIDMAKLYQLMNMMIDSEGYEEIR